MVMNLLFVLFDLEEKDFETLSCDLSLQNYIKIEQFFESCEIFCVPCPPLIICPFSKISDENLKIPKVFLIHSIFN